MSMGEGGWIGGRVSIKNERGREEWVKRKSKERGKQID